SAGIGYTLQLMGQQRTRPEAASLIMSLESVFAALAGWAMLREAMTARELLGCALLFGAIILVQTKADGKKQMPEHAELPAETADLKTAEQPDELTDIKTAAEQSEVTEDTEQ
ncbi:MAG: DMT family transporter, partial [Clostridia bacterium]|nr:DMT family transporter [Clostridia bacterium]